MFQSASRDDETSRASVGSPSCRSDNTFRTSRSNACRSLASIALITLLMKLTELGQQVVDLVLERQLGEDSIALVSRRRCSRVVRSRVAAVCFAGCGAAVSGGDAVSVDGGGALSVGAWLFSRGGLCCGTGSARCGSFCRDAGGGGPAATAGGFEAAVGGLGVAGAASWGGFGRGSISFAGIGSGRVFSATAALLAGRDVSRRPSLAWLSKARIATVIAPRSCRSSPLCLRS